MRNLAGLILVVGIVGCGMAKDEAGYPLPQDTGGQSSAPIAASEATPVAEIPECRKLIKLLKLRKYRVKKLDNGNYLIKTTSGEYECKVL